MWLYKKEWEAKIRAKPNKKSKWGEIIRIVFPQANNQERQILTVETSAVLLMLMADSGVGCTAISAKPGLGLRTFSKESFRSLILLCKTWFFNIPGKTPKHPYFPSLSRSSPTFRTWRASWKFKKYVNLNFLGGPVCWKDGIALVVFDSFQRMKQLTNRKDLGRWDNI